MIDTTIIPKLVKRVEEADGITLDGKRAIINQPLGVARAIELANKKIAVTVTNVEEARECRDAESATHTEVIIIGVHATGMDKKAAKEVIKIVDIIAGCASFAIRDAVGGRALAQAGTGVSSLALTRRGKELLLGRAKEVSSPILINTMKLPVLPEEKQPAPTFEVLLWNTSMSMG